MFKSYEEISQAYPIGYVYKTEEITQRLYCAHEIIFEQMKKYYGEENVEMTSPHHVTHKHLATYIVNGYLFDGENWYPAELHHGEWHVIPEEALN